MRRVATFDTETTGVDVENDRIVSAFVGIIDENGNLESGQSWLINPGIEIPQGAVDVHGITNDRVQAEGMSPVHALVEIELSLVAAIGGGLPVVAFNAPYDFTILDREIGRHLNRSLAFPPMPVIDPYVLDKAMDKYRSGSRKLVDVARHYFGPDRFAHTVFHGAEADAVVAGQIAQLLLEDHRLVGATTDAIHGWQITWARRHAESFRGYLISRGDDASGVSTEWPIHERKATS